MRLLGIVGAPAMVALIFGIALPFYKSTIEEARVVKCFGELNSLTSELESYRDIHGIFPQALDRLPLNRLDDPWGEPYQYQRLDSFDAVPRLGADQRPLNARFDLYSKGPDRGTEPSIAEGTGLDDIVMADRTVDQGARQYLRRIRDGVLE